MVEGIEHIAIFSEDTARLKGWYVAMFGFKSVYDNGRGTYFLKAQDGTMLEFVPTDTKGANDNVRSSGIRHIAIAVSDFDAMVDKLMSVRAPVVQEPNESKGVKTFFFRDLDGNVLHLVHRINPL